MVKFLIKTQNGRDKARYGVGVFFFFLRKNKQEAEFLMFSGNKTYATRKNAERSYAKNYPNDKLTYLKW